MKRPHRALGEVTAPNRTICVHISCLEWLSILRAYSAFGAVNTLGMVSVRLHSVRASTAA